MKISIERDFNKYTPLDKYIICNVVQGDEIKVYEGYCQEKKREGIIIRGMHGDIKILYNMITKIYFNSLLGNPFS